MDFFLVILLHESADLVEALRQLLVLGLFRLQLLSKDVFVLGMVLLHLVFSPHLKLVELNFLLLGFQALKELRPRGHDAT